MQCPRCAGMRVPELMSEGGMRVMALRCVLCGDIVDRVITRNREPRRQRGLTYPKRPRTPTYGSNRLTPKRLVWL